MSFEYIQEPNNSIQNIENYSSKPPCFGKDNWTVDPAKIVIKPQTNILPTIPEKEEEDVKEIVENVVKTEPKRVRFASYVDVYLRCPVDKNGIQYPSKKFAKMAQDNLLSLKEKRIEELEYKLKQMRQELTREHDNNILTILVSLLVILLVVSYKYANANL